MPPLILTAAILTLVIGSTVLWANPPRNTNKAFFAFSLINTGWLCCVYMAMRAGLQAEAGAAISPVPWIRAASAVGAFFPASIWLMKESILSSPFHERRFSKGVLGWLVVCCILAMLCYADSFVVQAAEAENRSRGTAYLVYSITSLALYLLLIYQTYRQWQVQTGICRLEIQFLILNAGVAGLVAVLVTAAGNLFDLRALSRSTPLIILAFYGLTAWGVTIHRVFDARQVFLSIGQRFALLVALTVSTYAVWRLLGDSLPVTASLMLSVALCGTFVFWLDHRTRDWLSLSPWQNTAAVRQTALDLARREPDPNRLVASFEGLLRTSCQSDYAVLLFDSGEVFVSGDIEFGKDRTAYTALCQKGWSTPESLQRLRPEPGLVDLRHFLTEFNLGVIVSAPRGSANPSLLLALGVKTNQRPFTYPEVQQVQEIAEFLDNILARSRLSLQARQSEQLATIGLIGASLAHEIRNPLVSIKTFSHLLPSRFDDPEFRRRFSLLIPAEVDRIDNLTQQLLDLSNPRRHQLERVSLHGIMQETTDLMLTRATEARVTMGSELNAAADTIWADGAAIRQVLINLLINAFQALETQDDPRRVLLRSRNSPNGSVILEVSDNGPGIPPEQRSRLFHPFVSTKTKGMGLGLAVCADILHEHRATIIVPDVGKPGATFRITFPCPPPLS
ncbi:Sensor protein ZraS [Lacunisphaera limnophila]|uniref:histidine kinase n=1 Tax=Lacunisphaera limnophila TaxID=1838286 RepID=A0A1D8AVC5_9BACT|nr:ATP-binding protein [Lacunisphaera limnophila]AOS44842.1 Sensor protein ZraS [Lacunisphaera limnophila]